MHFNSLNSLIKYKNVQFNISQNGDKFVFQDGYAYRRKNIPVQVNLSGTHYQMGLQYGVLLKDETRGMANSLHKIITYYSQEMKIPKDLVYIYFKYKINKLAKNIPERFKQEMQGISDGSGVDINAIYAISLFDDVVHTLGCSSILSRSEDGMIIHGRNEDLYFGMEMGMKQVLIKYNPQGYNSYISLTFPGFIGVSTGYNMNGLGYSHNSRFASNVNYKGYPQHCIPRITLEECSSVQEVINLYRSESITVGDAHTWSDRNNLTGCIIESVPDEKNPIKIIEMDNKILFHVNKYMNTDYIDNYENKYTSDDAFNNSRQHILDNLINKDKTYSLDNMISMLREEGLNEENYNLSGITRGICNIDTQEMTIFDPRGYGIYLARNYYLASKSTIYYIPVDFNVSPYVYKESEPVNPILEEIAIIKESVLSKSELINKLKELELKYPNEGYIYFMIGQASFDAGNLNDWVNYVEKSYEFLSPYDREEVTLEKAKVEFYKRNINAGGQLLSNINYEELKSFKSKAQFFYLLKLYYKEVNDKIKLQEAENKFLDFVIDDKTQKRIKKSMKFLER